MTSSSAFPLPRTVTIGDLRVCLRPVTPDDRERLLDGLRALSVETSYRRFFAPTFYPSEATLHYLTHPDGERHVAIGAVDCTREGTPGVGAARYVRLAEQPTVAEAAVVVVDAYQRQGIGSLLLAALSRVAADRGVDRFRGYVLADNRAFLRYLRALGAVNEQAHDAVIQLDVPVYARAAALPEAPETERARWAWHTLVDAPVGDCTDAPA
jgi:GNAT superfamily N-acetyltransferase